MPQQLKEHIVSKWRRHCEGDAAKEARCPQLRMVWTSCEGETGADKEHLGAVTYTPWQGFPGGEMPIHLSWYLTIAKIEVGSSPGHLPLLRFLLPLPEPDALQLTPHLAAVQEPDARGPHSDQVTSRQLVTVHSVLTPVFRCKAWARNIKHEELNPRVGGVHFEMMMD